MMKRRILILLIAAISMLAGISVQAASLKAGKISCSTKTGTSVTLKWAKVKGAKSYVLYQKSTGGYRRLNTVKTNTVKVTGLNSATSYTFHIKPAGKANGSSLGKKSPDIVVKTKKESSKLTFKISPSDKPCDQEFLRYTTYNKNTKHYYLIRSYLERIERAGGGTIVFKKGTYTITNVLYIPSNTTLRFEKGVKLQKSQKTGTSKMPPSNTMFHLIRPSKGQKKNAVGGYNGEKNIQLIGTDNVVFDMKRCSSKQNCIEGAHNVNLTIKNIEFRNNQGGHFIEMDATNGALVENCTFDGIYDENNLREGINLDTPDKKTGGFTAVWSKYDCTANKDVTIKNCTFKNMARAVGTHNYSYGHPHNNITVTGCTMTNVRLFGVAMMNWNNSTVTNNVIKGTGTMTVTNAGVLGQGVQHCTITGNKIDNYDYGILLKTQKQPEYKDKPRLDVIISDTEFRNMYNNTFTNIGQERIRTYRSVNDEEVIDHRVY